MSTEKIVMNALFGKTELKSTKIELGISEDMAKLTSESEAMLAKLKGALETEVKNRLQPLIFCDTQNHIF